MIRYGLARLFIRYHTSPYTPRWTKHNAVYNRLWNWSLATSAKTQYSQGSST